MIFIKNNYIYLVLFLTIVIINCNNETVNNGTLPLYIDPTILHTDSFGIILGGDTTDWCYRGNNEFVFNPAYPNPTYDTFKLNLTLTAADTISLFFLNSQTDTLYLFKDQYLQIGVHEIAISSQSLNYNSVTKRIFIEPKLHYNNNAECKFYGDIQFY